jgi:hypothetical protein
MLLFFIVESRIANRCILRGFCTWLPITQSQRLPARRQPNFKKNKIASVLSITFLLSTPTYTAPVLAVPRGVIAEL